MIHRIYSHASLVYAEGPTYTTLCIHIKEWDYMYGDVWTDEYRPPASFGEPTAYKKKNMMTAGYKDPGILTLGDTVLIA